MLLCQVIFVNLKFSLYKRVVGVHNLCDAQEMFDFSGDISLPGSPDLTPKDLLSSWMSYHNQPVKSCIA